MRVQLLTILVLLVAMVWFDGYCLADLARARYVRYLTRQAWALLIVATFPVGGMLYLGYGRPR
jgi:hypothetical protein